MKDRAVSPAPRGGLLRGLQHWFHTLRVSQKLMLISIFFVMPDSLMLYFFITGINGHIEFARMEEKGNAYQRPLESLLELLPRHDLLAQRAVGSDALAVAQLAREQAQIDAAFDRLEEIDARIGVDLQFTDEGLAKRKREHYRARTVRGEWSELKTELPKLDRASAAARHQHLIADVRMMITHAGDLSNLILDPDLDSYYLMDATLLALPQTQDRLAKMIAHGQAVLRDPPISQAERQQFAIHAELLQESDLDRIVSSLQTALNEDANFYGVSATLQSRLPVILREYARVTKEFIALTTDLANNDASTVSAKDYAAAGSVAREASFTLWKITAEEMDTLLRTRVHWYENRRARSLFVAALAALAAFGFVTFITRSISGPLRAQALETQNANDALQNEIAEREKVHRKLMEVSRQAGMAEVATGVLHNVGNVLNSVNVSAMVISERLSKSRIAHLDSACALLRANSADLGGFITNDPKGRKLPAFLYSLAERLGVEQAELLKEAEGLSKNITHIKDIVAVQQNYAKVSGVMEVLPAAGLVEDALEMNGAAFDRHRVEVARDFADVPAVRVDKHKVLQILINLIRNAKYAVSESSRLDKKIIVRLARDEAGGVQIVIEDNGIGIAPANLARIFAHGFTTKKDGHGFGLHSAALAATEIGGALIAQSAGPGQGATFILTLPADKNETAQPHYDSLPCLLPT